MLSAAVVRSFKGEAIVDDGGKNDCRDDDLQCVDEASFHVVVWVVGWPGRPG